MGNNQEQAGASAGDRLRAMRELMGMDRPEFSEHTGLNPITLANIELGKQRMNDDHFEKVLKVFPHYAHWLTFGGDIDVAALAAERDRICKMAALKLQLGDVPKGSGLERFKDET